MSKAYLTIDDGPSKLTKEIVDYLNEKDITPIMFFLGCNIEKNRENGIYAIKHGAIIGNHSFSHSSFLKMSLDECIKEIEDNEKLINSLYKEAGVKREYKLFRIPFLDRGGNADKLQKYLKDNGFCRLDDSFIKYKWYDDNKNNSLETGATFGFSEWAMEDGSGFTYDDIIALIDNSVDPEKGATLLNEDYNNIVIIHDHEEAEKVCPGYFYNIIDYVIEKGTSFFKPKFILNR